MAEHEGPSVVCQDLAGQVWILAGPDNTEGEEQPCGEGPRGWNSGPKPLFKSPRQGPPPAGPGWRAGQWTALCPWTRRELLGQLGTL